MATVATAGSGAIYNMLEQANRTHNGETQYIAETLTKMNAMLKDGPYLEANDQYNHTYVRRTSLPKGTVVGMNEGVPNELSGTEQITEQLMMLESRALVDARLMKFEGNPNLFRTQEINAFIEGLSQTLVSYLFYGNVATNASIAASGPNPKAITGLTARDEYNALADSYAYGAGGSSNLTSLWLISWGPDRVSFMYPKGDPTLGITHDDRGLQETTDAAGNYYTAWISYFRQHVGLMVKDPRCIQRLANIDSAPGTVTTTSMLDDANIDQLIDMVAALPQMGEDGNTAIYCNRAVWAQINKKAVDKALGFYPAEDPWGKRVMTFQGIPIRIVEGISNAEVAIS